MSRSHKKNPIYKDISKDGKKFANRTVRRTKDVPNGNQYRKVYPTWDVIDHTTYYSKEEWIARWYMREADGEVVSWWKNNKSLEESIADWRKWYYRK